MEEKWGASVCYGYISSLVHLFIFFMTSHFHDIVKKMVSKLLVANPNSRLSASQLLKLESLHGMVLYLKNRNQSKVQGSRTRSNSLVTERSRLNMYPKVRSTSANRLEKKSARVEAVILSKQQKDKYQDSDNCVRYKNVTSETANSYNTAIERKPRKQEQNCHKDENQLNVDIIKGNNDVQANFVKKHSAVKSSVNDRDTTSVSSERDGIKLFEKSNKHENIETVLIFKLFVFN